MHVPTTSWRAVILCALSLTSLPASAAPDDAFRARVASSAHLPAAPLLPREDFQARTGIRAMRLAPDGKHLAWLWVQAQGTSLWLLDTASGVSHQALASVAATSLDWSSDSQWLFIEQKARVSALPMQGGEARVLAALDEQRAQTYLGADPVMPGHYLLRDKDPRNQRFRLLRAGIDGARQTLYEGDAVPTSVAFDRDGVARFIGTTGKGGRTILQLSHDQWQVFMQCSALTRCLPLAVLRDGHLVMRSGAGERQVLVTVDPLTRVTRQWHADPEGIADLADVVLDPRTAQPLLASYDTERHHTYAIDPALAKPVARLNRRFPESNLDMDVASNGLFLVSEHSDRLQRDRYWTFDPATQTLRPVAEVQQAASRKLPEEALAYRIPVSWRASDGMQLHGFLSLPPGQDASRLPLILRPHGGPKAQTRPGYDMITQFLVNRGYAVFEPNYRTSTGYGRHYLFAARGDYGHGRVYQDMLEGMDWLLAHGVGDASRQAMAGHSYGGFATLVGLTYDSTRFRAGIAMATPPDLAFAFDTLAGSATPDGAVPVADELAELGANSPSAMAHLRAQAPERFPERVVRPLVLVSGARDDIVLVRSVNDYAARLKVLGKPVTLLIDPDSGHQLEAPMARMATLYLLESSLQPVLGGRADPTVDASLRAYLDKNLRIRATAPEVDAGQTLSPP